ncbi:MAG: hypothetical protein K9N06_00985 [Candidatus Cloacimonetes bacterium]|nr:hypothetical protein [Candidatus Cloacimonadota bacterium]
MNKKLTIIFIFLLSAYIITHFLIMDNVLKKNRETDKLNEEYQGMLEDHYLLRCENSYFKSREFISQLAENELGLYLPDDFADYAFYEVTEDQKEITLIQFLMPTAEAFSFQIPNRLQD